MSDQKFMTVSEFREAGLLAELNRWVLHPRGLALSVVVDDDGSERFGPIWDGRDDPEGIVYGDDLRALLPGLAAKANRAAPVKVIRRVAAFGWVYQPTGGDL